MHYYVCVGVFGRPVDSEGSLPPRKINRQAYNEEESVQLLGNHGASAILTTHLCQLHLEENS